MYDHRAGTSASACPGHTVTQATIIDCIDTHELQIFQSRYVRFTLPLTDSNLIFLHVLRLHCLWNAATILEKSLRI